MEDLLSPSSFVRVSGCLKASLAGEELSFWAWFCQRAGYNSVVVPWNYFVEEPGMVTGLGGAAASLSDICIHSIPCGVSATLILARDGAGSLAEAFWKICQKIPKETHMPQRQDAMYLEGQEINAENFSPWGLADLHLSWWTTKLWVSSVSAVASEWGGWLEHCWKKLCVLNSAAGREKWKAWKK